MKLLHACCVVFHGMIAGAYAHECLQPQAGVGHHVCAAAYGALTLAQGVFVCRLLRGEKSHADEPPV